MRTVSLVLGLNERKGICMNDNCQPKKEDLKWGAKQRLTFIEATAFWNGRLTTNMLAETFGIARRQAGKDIALYEALAPNNIIHNRGKRGYTTTDTFTPIFITGTSGEYLNWLQASLADSNRLLSFPVQFSETEILPIPQPFIVPEVLQIVIMSLRGNKPITLYFEKGGCYYYTVHTIIFDGHEWFIRGIDHPAQYFRTLKLSDIVKAESHIPEGYHRILSEEASKDPIKHDTEWHQITSIQITINPSLSNTEQETVKRLYHIQENSLEINIRAPLTDLFMKQVSNIKQNNCPVFIPQHEGKRK